MRTNKTKRPAPPPDSLFFQTFLALLVISVLQSVIPSPAYTGASHFEADYPFSDVNEIFDTGSLAEIPGFSQAATITSLSSQTRFRKPPSKARATAKSNPTPRARRPILSQTNNPTNPTAAFYDSSDEDIMQGAHELEYVSTLEREAFVEAQYQHLCCMPKKQSDDAEYLERQTKECIRTAHLTPVQAGKVRKLRAGKAKAIRANTAMNNASMTTRNFATITDILLRSIAITQVLAKDGESHEACAKLETIHEDTSAVGTRSDPSSHHHPKTGMRAAPHCLNQHDALDCGTHLLDSGPPYLPHHRLSERLQGC